MDSVAVFLFHRDLRLEDNTGFIAACKEHDIVIPCFIVDPRQTGKQQYKSSNALQFMKESLEDLSKSCASRGGRLYMCSGTTNEVISLLLKNLSISAVHSNRDYTPFAQKRDDEIDAACDQIGIPFYQYDDALLHAPEEVQKQDGGPYTVYTPFANKCLSLPFREPDTALPRNLYAAPIAGWTSDVSAVLHSELNDRLAVHGGRTRGVQLLRHIGDIGEQYTASRDIPSLDATSHLSAHHKFGTVSVRESYQAIRAQLGPEHSLIKELLWRDFFTHIAWHFPRVFGHAFHDQYDHLQWSASSKNFEAWCQGKTGFPIVDAGMRELVSTGFMHNRVRMITASFLVKDLHIDWRKGEKFFAQHLVDYDPAVNNGNWQWAASTGCDAQPYFRIFNPWLQQKRYDPECVYIRRWIQELADVPDADIHNWHKCAQQHECNYPAPITDHKPAAARAKDMYASCRAGQEALC